MMQILLLFVGTATWLTVPNPAAAVSSMDHQPF